MRLRRIAAVAATALATTVLLAAPASAGVGESGYCFDGGWTEIPVASSPVTLGIEMNVSPTGTFIALCYATSEVGFGGAHVTGGLLKVYLNPTATSGYVQCRPDANPYVVLVDCEGTYSFSTATGKLELLFTSIVIDTSLTAPITIGKTGVVIDPNLFPGGVIGLDPLYPCVWVDGVQRIGNCGTQIF